MKRSPLPRPERSLPPLSIAPETQAFCNRETNRRLSRLHFEATFEFGESWQSIAPRGLRSERSSTLAALAVILRRTSAISATMPGPISVGIAVGAAVGCSAIAQSRLQAARDAKAAERDASTISGILKDISLTTSRVRRGTYGRLASGSTPRSAPQRRQSTKRVPTFALGEIAGLSVRVPADGKTCGPQGLLVTDILRGQWAQQCGVAAGARLMAIDGTRLEGLDAAAIRLAASSASRPIWLDVQKGGHAPTGDALSGAHLLL